MNSNLFRIFCIGRNYGEHAKELGSEIPESPVVFLKPQNCIVEEGIPVKFPKHGKEFHHEVELVIRIGKAGNPESAKDAISYIDSLAIGLDLTLRDLQNQLKNKGLPWEPSKAFEQSSPIGKFKKYDSSIQLNNISFSCKVDGELRQNGNSKDMLFSVETLIFELGKIWTLQPGDLIYTGTPSGVGPMHVGNKVTISSELLGTYSWDIIN
jgi:2-keto-4-pentenoate hydratase/2-oxohepta-3-ene-1,7-dioic acid hydratase in catechol pathway